MKAIARKTRSTWWILPVNTAKPFNMRFKEAHIIHLYADFPRSITRDIVTPPRLISSLLTVTPLLDPISTDEDAFASLEAFFQNSLGDGVDILVFITLPTCKVICATNSRLYITQLIVILQRYGVH